MGVRISMLLLVLAPAAAFVLGVQARGWHRACQAPMSTSVVAVRVSEAPAMFGGGGGARAKKVVAKKAVKKAAKKVVKRAVKRAATSDADTGIAVDGYLAKSAAELFTPENRLPAAVGAAALVGQLTQPLVVGLDRLGLIELPPLNALTSIANAAMDAEIEAGRINPMMGTAWVQGFYKDLIGQYAASPDGFLQAYCGDAVHKAWCTADTVVSALQAASQ
jgi:hypothetical protein